jgi:hypothetical protein
MFSQMANAGKTYSNKTTALTENERTLAILNGIEGGAGTKRQARVPRFFPAEPKNCASFRRVELPFNDITTSVHTSSSFNALLMSRIGLHCRTFGVLRYGV